MMHNYAPPRKLSKSAAVKQALMIQNKLAILIKVLSDDVDCEYSVSNCFSKISSVKVLFLIKEDRFHKRDFKRL